MAIAFFWIIGFPWYLAVRYKINTGIAILKDDRPTMPPNTTPEP
jgi:hypothetical protein